MGFNRESPNCKCTLASVSVIGEKGGCRCSALAALLRIVMCSLGKNLGFCSFSIIICLFPGLLAAYLFDLLLIRQ